MTPKELEHEFVRLVKLSDPRAYVQRLYDSADVHGLNKGRGHSFAQPSDFLVTAHGRMFYAEVKMCGNKTSFSFGNIRPAQKRACKLQINAGGVYAFYIYSTINKQWYYMHGQQFIAAEKQSIKWKDLSKWT